MSDDIKRMSESEPDGPRMPEGIAMMPLKVRRGRTFECGGRNFSPGESIPEGHPCRVSHSSYLTHDFGTRTASPAPVAAAVSPPASESDSDDGLDPEADTKAPRGARAKRRKRSDD